MKLFNLLALASPILAQQTGPADERAPDDRYLYDFPLCETVQECAGVNDCNGQTYTAPTGIIELKNYENQFNCRWEIKGSPNSKIAVKFYTGGDTFGVESHSICGSDRLHVVNGVSDERYIRACSSANKPWLPINAIASESGIKNVDIRNKFYELDANHIVIGFDSDQQTSGVGFKIEYEIRGNTESVLTHEQNGNKLEDELIATIEQLISLTDPRRSRLTTRVERMFARFDTRMGMCRNGDQSTVMSEAIDIPSIVDFATAKAEWLSFFQRAFDNCDLPITKNGFVNSSWPRRINNVFAALGHGTKIPKP